MENKDLNFCYYSGLPSTMSYMEVVKELLPTLNTKDVDRIIETALEYRTSFDAIEFQFGLNEANVKALMI